MNHASSRRGFLKQGALVAGAAAVPYTFQSLSVAEDAPKSKNDRLKIGLIGAGGMGVGNMNSARDWLDVVAIADVDSTRCDSANHSLSGGKAQVFRDYRHVLEMKGLDALHIATPDHWHTKPLVEALRAGFDVYCEKPLTLTVDEGKLIEKVVKETGRVVQVGTQQRSTFNLFTKAIAMVQQGRIGKIKKLTAGIGGAPASPALPVAPAPVGLDWDRWIGPAPMVEHRQLTVSREDGSSSTFRNSHYEFRWWYEYSGGKMTDWGAHHVDIAMWALEVNGQAADPISIGGQATHPVPLENGVPTQTDRYNSATDFDLTAKFPGDVELQIKSGGRNGVLIEGDKGRIFVNRGELNGAPVEALADDPLPEDAVQKVYRGMPMQRNERQAHWANFIHCLKERAKPISDVESHVKALNVCHLANISARLGREIAWDSQQQTIPGDDMATSMLKREYRKGYEIEI